MGRRRGSLGLPRTPLFSSEDVYYMQLVSANGVIVQRTQFSGWRVLPVTQQALTAALHLIPRST